MQHAKNQEDYDPLGKNQPRDPNAKMTPMLELSDEDLLAGLLEKYSIK
jgi:hypothetical protein